MTVRSQRFFGARVACNSRTYRDQSGNNRPYVARTSRHGFHEASSPTNNSSINRRVAVGQFLSRSAALERDLISSSMDLCALPIAAARVAAVPTLSLWSRFTDQRQLLVMVRTTEYSTPRYSICGPPAMHCLARVNGGAQLLPREQG